MSDILTDAELAEIEEQGADLELFADRIFATIRSDRKEIARLRGIEERAKAVLGIEVRNKAVLGRYAVPTAVEISVRYILQDEGKALEMES